MDFQEICASVKYLTHSFVITDVAPSSKDIAELKRLKDAVGSNVREEAFKKAQEIQTKIDSLEEKMASSTKVFQGKKFSTEQLCICFHFLKVCSCYYTLLHHKGIFPSSVRTIKDLMK